MKAMGFLFVSACMFMYVYRCMLCVCDVFLPPDGIASIDIYKRAKLFYITTRNNKGERNWLHMKSMENRIFFSPNEKYEGHQVKK